MKLLWFTQIHFEFTINSSFFREFTMRLLSIPWFEYEVTINFIIDFELTIYFANWLCIDYMRFDYDYLSREFTTHTLIRDMAMTLLSISWFDYEFIIYFAIWLWNQCAFNEISINALSFSQNLLWLSTSNDYNFDFSKKCRLKTCKLNIFRLIGPISLIRQVWPYFDLWWSLITQIDLE